MSAVQEERTSNFHLEDLRERVLNKNVSVKDAEIAILVAIEELKAWKSIYAECLRQRGFEIAQLIQRNNFFMIFQGVLFAGICQSAAAVPVVSLIICLVGFGTSLFQASMAAGAKYWQEHWELNTRSAEREMTFWLMAHRIIRAQINKRSLAVKSELVDRLEVRKTVVRLFEDNKNRDRIRENLKSSRPWAPIMNFIIMRRFSASRIPVYVGGAFALAWLLLLLCTFRVDGLDSKVPKGVTGFPISEAKK
ncbi:RipA family octameric membrane protein [Pseudomonas asiatica]|uniref:SLATT domain-containing protein n=1 Tax=Pseudomonas asiatica TaxID=2219225 RepID=A0ABU5L4A2_9PSED|nr:hypothetical protein [Pseudomonas asiatica]MDZ5740987.1 hypothetical protein [Pseudomonas asiatica]MDZ5746308.1 hypothetical protein [Pseudomonas asiatica]MDZ5751247.1 hypothetical protein [Pseudomonas asiatica]MDZ5756285.1 hypothetical protein [Pseudomonas asiatica]